MNLHSKIGENKSEYLRMKLTQSGWVTLKEVPKDAEVISHQLQMRAGLIHKVGGGIYNYMPFAVRILRKIKQIVREEMDKIGSHEVTMSLVTPSELWKESGRWEIMGPNMARFKDRNEKDLCLSPTNEETVCDIFRSFVQSYKQLPITYYQINTKFRDEIRPRFGLMRGREFIMKDGYSFHESKSCLNSTYQKIFKAYENSFQRMGLTFIAVEADGGVMATGDSKTHEFQVIAETGEDKIVYCPETGWGANIEKAITKRKKESLPLTAGELKKVSTPLKKLTMDEAAAILQLPLHHCLKTVCYRMIKNKSLEVVLAFVLGDDEINEVKLKNYLNADDLISANEEDLVRNGLPKGFIGPMNLKQKIKMIFDSSINPDAYYAVGANESDAHYIYFNLKRDLANNFEMTDLRQAKDGDLTLEGHPIVLKKGIEVGHIFQLGDKYTKAMNISVLDNSGKKIHPEMGCYGIGISRLMSAAIEQHFDEFGIKWPISIAPFHIYFARIAKTPEAKKIADVIYQSLIQEGFEVLYDDRDLSPGVMFKESDLLGLPIRLVYGERDYGTDQQLEVKFRSNGQSLKIQHKNLIQELKKISNDLWTQCSVKKL